MSLNCYFRVLLWPFSSRIMPEPLRVEGMPSEVVYVYELRKDEGMSIVDKRNLYISSIAMGVICIMNLLSSEKKREKKAIFRHLV